MIDRKWLAAAFKALSDLTRLRVVRLLAANEAQICVCEFVDVLQERQYTVSRGLGLLERAGLVEGHRDGRWVYYSLVKRDDAVATLLHELVASVSGDEVFSLDQRRFDERMALREDGRCRLGIQTEGLANG
jgi:ArsR family transcriptional regulator